MKRLILDAVSHFYTTKADLILDRFSHVFSDDTITLVTGPSGCGKSTLLHIMAGILSPKMGQITSTGRLGLLFQDFHLIDDLSVKDNCKLALIAAGVDSNVWESRIQTGLSELGLLDKLEATPNQLSGGEKQRVSFLRATIHEPEILLCDEPTGNLDDGNTAQFIELIGSFQKRHAACVVIVTHDTRLDAFKDAGYLQL